MVFELPPRGVKPRKRGLTTMIDFGPDEMGWTGGTGGIESRIDGLTMEAWMSSSILLAAILG